MNRILITLCLSIVFNFTGFAQQYGKNGRGKMHEKIQAQKISFITQKLELTPKEAQTFWPLYNELESKKKELRKKSRTLFWKLRHKENTLSDKELAAISDELINIRVTDVNLDKEYHNKYKKILPAKKILDLYHAEKKFQNMLLRQIKERGRSQHSKRNLNEKKAE